jgi:hypothetical protein
MKNGVLKETDGWDILVDGKGRTFHDIHDVALEVARELKRTNKGARIQVRTRATGKAVEMMADGRIK